MRNLSNQPILVKSRYSITHSCHSHQHTNKSVLIPHIALDLNIAATRFSEMVSIGAAIVILTGFH